MRRRTFIQSFAAAGMLSLLEIIHLHDSVRAGERVTPAPGLSGPFDITFESSRNLLVSDPPGYQVVRLNPSHMPVSRMGEPGSDVGKLNFPRGLAVDARGLIYVVDSNNCRVQVFDSDGNVKQVVGSIGSIGGTFATPQGICLDRDGRLLVADTRNHRIQIFKDWKLTAVLGDLGDDPDQFRLPTACSVNADNEILVLDSKHGLVKVFGKDLKFKKSFGGVGSEPGKLNMSQGMKLDLQGYVWIADTGNHRIQQFSPDGTLVTCIGKKGTGPKEFTAPTGIALTGKKIYVADNGAGRIQVLSRT